MERCGGRRRVLLLLLGALYMFLNLGSAEVEDYGDYPYFFYYYNFINPVCLQRALVCHCLQLCIARSDVY